MTHQIRPTGAANACNLQIGRVLGRYTEVRPRRFVGCPSNIRTVNVRSGLDSSTGEEREKMEAAVIIVGAGPVGLMLAGELRLAGLPVVVFEQRETPAEESRGIGFTARAAEVFDQRGLMHRFGAIESGQDGHFGGVRIDFNMLEDNHFGVRRVPQYRIEHGLEEWAGELGATIMRGCRVVDIRMTDDAVVAVVDGPDGRVEHAAEYLVGCDGGRSMVRQRVGIDFPGTEPTRGMYLADIVGAELRPRYIGERVPGGMVMSAKLDDGRTRITIHEDFAPPPGARTPTFTEIADTWQRLTGESIHHGQAKWISVFTDSTRQAAEYRRGRVLLAGDAAHIHLPAGAQGLSVGVQDAVNLGWKLAATIKGWAPAGLLDTYHTERHPVGARVLRNTQAQGLIYLKGDEMNPLRSVLGELMELPEAAALMAGMVSGLDIRYDVSDVDHPLLGRRMPDRDLTLADGRHTRVFELLRPARGLLIGGDLAAARRPVADWSDRIDVITASWRAASAQSPDANTDSVLIRPDGYVAWTAPGGDLTDALHRWFGPPGETARSGNAAESMTRVS
jgi:2-polyprenyl-6-methoxyphenol hydroxylase-like FAD-dependent oxidoreductase